MPQIQVNHRGWIRVLQVCLETSDPRGTIMKTRERFSFYLKKRHAQILHDIEESFREPDMGDKQRGPLTWGLEHILDYYATTEDYMRRVGFSKKRLKFLIEHDREIVEEIIKSC